MVMKRSFRHIIFGIVYGDPMGGGQDSPGQVLYLHHCPLL